MQEIASQVGENAFADISYQIDGAETIFFREQFADWSDEADWQPGDYHFSIPSPRGRTQLTCTLACTDHRAGS
jgi:hypothetical protein